MYRHLCSFVSVFNTLQIISDVKLTAPYSQFYKRLLLSESVKHQSNPKSLLILWYISFDEYQNLTNCACLWRKIVEQGMLLKPIFWQEDFHCLWSHDTSMQVVYWNFLKLQNCLWHYSQFYYCNFVSWRNRLICTATASYLFHLTKQCNFLVLICSMHGAQGCSQKFFFERG